MINLPHAVRVFLHTPATDLRKGFDALCGLVTTAFSQDPTSGHLFLFVNRRRDRLKILYWDRDGLAVWYKKQVLDYAHSFAFTEIDGRPHNCLGRPAAAGGMDSRLSPIGPRR
jgi:hypothetical protein